MTGQVALSGREELLAAFAAMFVAVARKSKSFIVVASWTRQFVGLVVAVASAQCVQMNFAHFQSFQFE